MNKNDKFHNAASELNEEQLDSVSGGAAGDITCWEEDYCEKCGKTTSHYLLDEGNRYDRMKTCSVCKTARLVPYKRTVF